MQESHSWRASSDHPTRLESDHWQYNCSIDSAHYLPADMTHATAQNMAHPIRHPRPLEQAYYIQTLLGNSETYVRDTPTAAGSVNNLSSTTATATYNDEVFTPSGSTYSRDLQDTTHPASYESLGTQFHQEQIFSPQDSSQITQEWTSPVPTIFSASSEPPRPGPALRRGSSNSRYHKFVKTGIRYTCVNDSGERLFMDERTASQYAGTHGNGAFRWQCSLWHVLIIILE
ncbi:hypothetical protein M422DRAFT_250021 [Sphaerobolus stellatus SS14]|nr:hypothetical protein M422DRAFT_250021 [Sphaerobolus stellatus SS14]